MKMTLWKTGILLRKTFLEEISYRLNFVMEAGTILFYTSVFFFIGRIIPGEGVRYLDEYGGDYFSFVLIGLAFSGFMNVCLSTFATTLRNEQMTGTLEALLTTPTPVWIILFARLLWNFFYGSIHIVIYFIFGIFLMSAEYGSANLSAVPLILLLSLAAFSAMGLISASFILVFKRGDPLNIFLGFATAVLGGVYFPIEALPASLRAVSDYIPLTYTLRLMRDACIRGHGAAEMGGDLLILALLAAVLLPAGVLCFAAALRRTRRDGSLSHY